MVPVQKFREIVLQLLFSYDLNESDPEELCSFLMAELKVSRKVLKEALAEAQAVLGKREMLDEVLAKVSTSYDFTRIHRVERAILRLAAFELIEKKLATTIVIAEAKRLAKKFSAPEAAGFCQALLDALAKNSE